MSERIHQNCLLYSAPSGIAGMGLFASREIEEGEVLFTVKGEEISGNNPAADDDWFANCFQIDTDRYVYPASFEGRYINHSCTPNAGLRADLRMIALRPIPAGHEVTFDYSTCTSENAWTMRCGCGTPACRGLIGDFHDLPASLQGSYLCRDVVQLFIVKEIFHRAHQAAQTMKLPIQQLDQLASGVVRLSASLPRGRMPDVA